MPRHAVPYRDTLLMIAAAVSLVAALSPWLTANASVLAVTTLAAAAFAGAALALRARYPGSTGFGCADRVTLARLAIVAVLTGQLAGALGGPAVGIALAALALIALVLDGIDGWLARRLRESSAFGARLDMETDALLILVLCALIWLGGRAGVWVLAIGGLRYAFLLAQLIWPRLAAPLPPSQRRRTVCAIQVGILPVCLLPILPSDSATALAAAALALLCYSFSVDIHWLIRHGEPRATPE